MISKEQIVKIRRAHHAHGLGFSVDQRDNRIYVTIRRLMSGRPIKIDVYTSFQLRTHLSRIFKCDVYCTNYHRWANGFEATFRILQ